MLKGLCFGSPRERLMAALCPSAMRSRLRRPWSTLSTGRDREALKRRVADFSRPNLLVAVNSALLKVLAE